VDGEAEDTGHDEDGDELVDLGPDQDGVAREIADIVARDRVLDRLRHGDKRHHGKPSDAGHRPGDEHEARLEAQGAQSDKDEQVEEGRDLE
jgi:hypothetical protein